MFFDVCLDIDFYSHRLVTPVTLTRPDGWVFDPMLMYA